MLGTSQQTPGYLGGGGWGAGRVSESETGARRRDVAATARRSRLPVAGAGAAHGRIVAARRCPRVPIVPFSSPGPVPAAARARGLVHDEEIVEAGLLQAIGRRDAREARTDD